MARSLPQGLRSRLISALFDHPEPSGVSDVSLLNTNVRHMDEVFQLSWQRRGRYQDFERMDQGYLAPALDAIAVTCTRYRDKPTNDSDILEFPRGFKIELDGYGTSGPRKVIEQFLKDTRLKDKSYDYVRNLVKYGDIFFELIFVQDAILGVQRYPSSQIWVNKDPKGFFYGNDKEGNPQAYQQRELQGKVVAGFEPWQIVHLKFHETDLHAYSEKSLLDDVREDWWKLSFEEQALVIARITRAFPRAIHTLDVTGKSEVEQRTQLQAYVNQVTRKQTRGGNMIHNATSPDEDFFRTTQYHNPNSEKPLPKLDKIEFYDPKMEGLSNIEDIRYLRGKLFTRVPSELIGIADRPGSDITLQDLAFIDLCNYVTERYEVGLRQAIDTQLLLKGYRDVTYRITFPVPQINANWKHADAEYRTALADQVHWEIGDRSIEEMLRRDGRTDADIAKIMAEVLANRDKFGNPNQKASQRGSGVAQT